MLHGRSSSLRGAWLGSLWATLAGRPQSSPIGPGCNAPHRLDFAPDDVLIAYIEEHPAPLAVNAVDLPSPILGWLATNGVWLLVPLVTQGRLVGLLSLGEPVRGGAYSADDLAFLTTLADEAAAAVRIAQLQARGAQP